MIQAHIGWNITPIAQGLIATDRILMRQVHPHNPIAITTEDAQALGIRNGDRICLVTPGSKKSDVAVGSLGSQHNEPTEYGTLTRVKNEEITDKLVHDGIVKFD